jgi:hypothetical protein
VAERSFSTICWLSLSTVPDRVPKARPSKPERRLPMSYSSRDDGCPAGCRESLGCRASGDDSLCLTAGRSVRRRGHEARSVSLFSYVWLEERVPGDHPLRPIRALAEALLAGLSPRSKTR